MENEENRGLINKNASEDYLVTFFQFNFEALSLFSLSHLVTQSFLGALQLQIKEGKQEKGNEGKKGSRKESRIKQLQQEYLEVTFCMCDFLAGFDMHAFTCWCMVIFVWVAWFCQVMAVAFSVTLPFLVCLGMLGFSSWF